MPQQPPTLHAVGNAHIDPVWLWRWTEGLETIRATFRSALDRMNEYPEFHFTGSSAAFYALLGDTDPEMLAEIAQRVREGRWEIVGGWWVQPDANVPGGEGLVRQGLYGQRYFQQAFGTMATIGYNPDTFGHPGSLPKILRGCGMSRYVFMRPEKHEKELPGNVFQWRSADGSEVLTARVGRGYATGPDEIERHIVGNHEARPDYLRDYYVMYGVGNHGGGPTKRNIEAILAADAREGGPHVRLSTLTAMFESYDREIAAGAHVPVVADELQHHARGCYTSHSEIKRQNRRLEHLLMAAERIASAAWYSFDREYPTQELEKAWQAVLFQQFHDVLAGTSLPEGYQDARDFYGYAAKIAGDALHKSAQALARRIDTRGEGSAVVIVNPLPWSVRVPVEVERGAPTIVDADGKPILAQPIQPTTNAGQRRSVYVLDLPPLGYRLIRELKQSEAERSAGMQTLAESDRGKGTGTPSAGMLRASTSGLENDFWRLSLDPVTGQIASLLDKRRGVEAMAAPGNACVVIDDKSDTWSHAVVSFRDEIGRFGDAKITIEEEGPVRAAVRIETAWGRSTATQRIFLYRDIDTIELRLTLNWQEHLKMLKLAFPLKLEDPRALYDIAYGCIERGTDGQEEPGQQWIAVTGQAADASGRRVPYGVALLNDGKYGFDVLGSEMRVTVLRSPAYAHHDPRKIEEGVDYQYLDQGIQTVTCRLVPFAGDWRDAALSRRSWELAEQPFAINEYQHAGDLPASASFLTASPDNILLSVCKKAEDSSALIVRGYETAGRATRATISLPSHGVSFGADFGTHEIRTWQIDRTATPRIAPVDMLERPLAG